MDVWERLEEAWTPARRAGVIGTVSIEELRSHAVGYLPAACGRFAAFDACDLGSGAGIPGLLLALWCPESRWTLVDALERRCEMARAAIRALELGDRVEVVHASADDLGHDDRYRHRFDLVVARSFGPPSEIVELGLPLTTPEGQLVVSATTETTAVFVSSAADEAGVVGSVRVDDLGRYVELRRGEDFSDALPRRRPRRRRDPLLPSMPTS